MDYVSVIFLKFDNFDIVLKSLLSTALSPVCCWRKGTKIAQKQSGNGNEEK